MASIDAKNVAKELLETMGKGQKVVLGKIIRKHGYSKRTSEVPSTVTNTKSFQDVVNPVVEKYQALRDKIIDEMNRKGRKLSKEKLISLTTALKNTTHDLQLLTGGKTENTGIGELADQLNSWINSNK